MPPRDKLRATFDSATAAPTTPPARPAPAPGAKSQMTTLRLDARLWAELQGWLGTATVQLGRKAGIGRVGATLFELLLEDPDLQQRVIDRMR